MTTKPKATPTPPAGPDTTTAPGDTQADTDTAGTRDVHFSDVHDGEPVHDNPVDQDKPGPAPKRAETLDEERDRLRRELARVEEQGARQGGFKEIPTHMGVLMCGCNVQVSNTNGTEHFCKEHDVEVPFVNYFPITDKLREKILSERG